MVIWALPKPPLLYAAKVRGVPLPNMETSSFPERVKTGTGSPANTETSMVML